MARRTSTKTSCMVVYQCSSSSIGRLEQVWKLPHLPSRNSNGWKSFLHKKVFAALLTTVVYVHTNIRSYVCCCAPTHCHPVVVGRTGALQAGRQAAELREEDCELRGEARGFKATGLACLAHQSPGIKCEQSCFTSARSLACLLSFS